MAADTDMQDVTWFATSPPRAFGYAYDGVFARISASPFCALDSLLMVFRFGLTCDRGCQFRTSSATPDTECAPHSSNDRPESALDAIIESVPKQIREPLPL